MPESVVPQGMKTPGCGSKQQPARVTDDASRTAGSVWRGSGRPRPVVGGGYKQQQQQKLTLMNADLRIDADANEKEIALQSFSHLRESAKSAFIRV